MSRNYIELENLEIYQMSRVKLSNFIQSNYSILNGEKKALKIKNKQQ